MRVLIYAPREMRGRSRHVRALRERLEAEGHEPVGDVETPAEAVAARQAGAADAVTGRDEHLVELTPPWVLRLPRQRTWAVAGAVWLWGWARERPRLAAAAAAVGAGVVAAGMVVDGQDPPGDPAPPPAVAPPAPTRTGGVTSAPGPGPVPRAQPARTSPSPAGEGGGAGQPGGRGRGGQSPLPEGGTPAPPPTEGTPPTTTAPSPTEPPTTDPPEDDGDQCIIRAELLGVDIRVCLPPPSS